MRREYPNSAVKICRDHCGPGFTGSHDIEDTYKSIKADINNGFDLIHIDFCHFNGDSQEKLEAAKKAILYCLELNPNIKLEIGTDENLGDNFSAVNLDAIERDIDFFKEFCNPEFFVVQTGSLVKEINQAGNFNKSFISRVSELLHSKGLKLKEHNGDYLSTDELNERSEIVDAINIAPQLGVIQTNFVMCKCLEYGVKFDEFAELVYSKRKWEKWLDKNTEENKMLCVLTAGHYHFASEEFKRIMSELEEREDIKENIIDVIMEVIDHYDKRE